MTVLDWIAIALLVFIGALAIAVLVFLGGWPGRVARLRRHPYETAITVGGWVTLLTGGVFYPLVLVWAYAGGHPTQPPPDEEVNLT